MPLVFVHGVNTRRGSTPAEHSVFDNRVAFFRSQFRNVAFAKRVPLPAKMEIFTPYWGDLGVKFPHGLRFLPSDGLQALSTGQPELAPLIEATSAQLGPDLLTDPGFEANPILTAAKRRNLIAAIDLLSSACSTAPADGLFLSAANQASSADEAARFIAAASELAQQDPRPTWLEGLTTDEELIEKLSDETVKATAGSIQTLSIGSTLSNWIGNAKSALQAAAGGLKAAAGGVAVDASRAAFMAFSGKIRPAASTFIGTFFGDVFTYMENRKPIIDLVLADIDKALAARTVEDKELYLVGHSFGGIILYDILTAFRPDIKCDIYVTVGSQVALFAEIGRLADKTPFPTVGDDRLPRPASVMRWINAADSTDFVGFGIGRTFRDTEDFMFETDAFPIVAHGAYFDTPRLYQRLQAHI